MSSDPNLAVTISEAWALHRNAQNEEAIATFERVLSQDPSNVDAHYGRGLALRALGKKDEAAKAFRNSHGLTVENLRTIRKEREHSIQHAADNLVITEDDRFSMLARMTKQRLQELGVDVSDLPDMAF